MPSAKRSYERNVSGNTRPNKTAKFGHESGEDSGSLANSSSDNEMSMDEESFITTDPTCSNANDRCSIRYTSMRAAQIVAWPTSLAAIKKHFQYNLAPQEGLQLPDHIVQLISSRIVRRSVPDGPEKKPRSLPHLHLGSIPFLETQIFVFLPNLRNTNSFNQSSGCINNSILERWTDTIFLPSLSRKDPHAPSSWHQANLYSRSPGWCNEDETLFPSYNVYDNQQGKLFASTWQGVLDLSMRVPEFQHPYLVLYSDGECPQVYSGYGPDETMQKFETAWHEHVDMTYIPWPQDNLQVVFNYESTYGTRNLPMR